jgi:hypothetical protein
MAVFKVYGYYHEYLVEGVPADRGFEGALDDAVSAFLCSPDDHLLSQGEFLAELMGSGIPFHLSTDYSSMPHHAVLYCYSRLLLVIPNDNDAIFVRMRWGLPLAGPIQNDADFSWV